MGSTAHRDKGGTPAQITLSEEKSIGEFPPGYREVPSVAKDDDGYGRSNVTKATRPTVACGEGIDEVEDRIADCLSNNPSSATWDGTVNGNAGEGIWRLVTRTSGGQEVWQDTRTHLLWSDRLSSGDNWCRASGNAESTDPSNFCNNGTYQNQTTPTSYCAEATGLSPRLAGENWTNGTYHAGKGSMGKIATATSPSVRWRLPSIHDWNLADVNGVRHVLPNMGDTWSATVSSNSRNLAWYFSGTDGWVRTQTRSGNRHVRCVGR